MAVDEVMSLAREVSMDHDPEVGLALRVRAVFDRDDRWASSLGPQRLSHQFQTPEDAFGIVPSELWWNTLAMILRAVPAAGPDSTCRDASDATIESPERVFQTMLDDLRLLIVQSSSLLIPDQAANHEIHGVIRNLAARLSVE
ncbi:MAG: hypothetical protein EA377_08560 [Phycisphaerales bacterium]|nr:MAG: hypothetical protein EA377_08560 [Phycisphaerales bacterium]